MTILSFLKQFFCKHAYENQVFWDYSLDPHGRKFYEIRCEKCGKEKK